uniref:matrix metalloproteinase-28 isoform X2 n=1 Tax=Pristiophorus japonicus TaxID=55135 RepID=UPI00398F202F
MSLKGSLQRFLTLEILGVGFLLLSGTPCVPVDQTPERAADSKVLPPEAPVAFLEKYGYLDPGSPEGLNSAQVKEAVREFQWIAHLPVSGTLDETTIRQMAEPRCGVKDIGSHGAWEEHVETLFLGRASKPSRTKRYAQQGEKWYKHHLTYKIINWPRSLEQSRVKMAVKTAFQLWSNVSPLTFWEVKDGPADIRLAFYQGEHNDGIGNAFDGPGEPLRPPVLQLLTAFQNPAEHTQPAVPSDSRLPPSYCHTHFDTLTQDLKQNIYIFRGADYWKLAKDGNIKGPLSLQKSWPELPAAIEAAAVSERGGKFYFFRGGRCWRYSEGQLDEGFPMKVKAMGLPRHPDAAFYFRPLSHVVIFKGSKYYVLNEDLMQVEQYYPRTLSDWKGVPVGINGVFTWNDKRTYFFKDETFWKFDNSRLKVLHQGKWAQELHWSGCCPRNITDTPTLQT